MTNAPPETKAKPASRQVGPSDLPGVPKPVQGGITGIGGFMKFSFQAAARIPAAIRMYPSEIVRQAGLVSRSSAFVIAGIMFNLGILVGLLAHTNLTPLGAGQLSGSATTIGLLRGLIEVLFGWIVAAKIGCGLVAEIGAMKINEETDALEVMGINPITYLISTRISAIVLIVPSMVIAGFWPAYWGTYLFVVPLLNDSSEGSYWRFVWTTQNLYDFLFVVPWCVINVIIAVIVGCYYGYTAKGGPVGVGENTSKSMLTSMVVVSIIGALCIQLFYGIDANSPFGN